MRVLLVALLLYAHVARADGIGAGAAVGAGGQGEATYNAIDLGLDAQWRGARLGVGARGVWIDGEWRERDFRETRDAVRAIRLLEVRAEGFALAGGGLAPAWIGHAANGHRAALDDRPRTGARAAAIGDSVQVGAEIDDVLDPSLVGGTIAWEFARHWRVRAVTAVDPIVDLAAIEFSFARRTEGEKAAAEIGSGFVAEPHLGAHAIVFADVAIERAGARWFANVEGRAGTGTVGAAFGPLHRIERDLHRGTQSVGGAISIGVAAPFASIAAGVRARPELGTIATASAVAPMGKSLQAGAWIAASRRATAGAGELRLTWARRYSTVIEIARMYDSDAMLPTPIWSTTAWFGITTH